MIYIVCECAWNWLVETVTARAILRQDLTVFLYFLSVCVFFNIIIYMRKFTVIFVPAVTTCDRFLCCYCETCLCRNWPSSEPSWIS